MQEFEKAAKEVNELKNKPSNDELLKLYGLYKQATVGDVNTGKSPQDIYIYIWNLDLADMYGYIERPGAFDFKGKAKWDAWNALKGKLVE